MESYQKEMLLAALGSNGQCDIRVHGHSMKPFIRDSDTVLITRKSKGPFLGEVVAFFIEDQLFVHRIVWMRKATGNDRLLWVWGDSSRHSLGKIWWSEIIGTVTHVSRGNKPHDFWLRFPFSVCAILIGFIMHGVLFVKTAAFRPD